MQLEASRDSVATCPLWLAITVRNAGRRVIESGLPPISLLEQFSVGIAVRGTGSSIVVPPIDPSAVHGAPLGYALAPGEARTFLVDFADVCPGLPPGDHDLAIALPSQRAVGRASLRVLPPTEDERELATHLRGADGWLQSMVFDPREPEVRWSTLSPRIRAAISMYALLRRATWAPRLSDVPLAMLRGFTGLLEGEAAVLAYEIARAGQDPHAPALRREAASRWPPLAWRLDEIDDDLGLLAQLRELRELSRG